ncbi:AMIN-like domain-containing (lipo)protein [Streptomyces sp. S6]
MRRTAAAVAALALAVTALGTAATTATAAQGQGIAACPTGWGSLDKNVSSTKYKPLTDGRTGQHDCYDRIVFDIPGGGTGVGYRVGYVDALHQDGTGDLIPVSGGAILSIRLVAPSYDYESGKPSYPGRARQPLPGVDVTGYTTFRDTRFASSFEGETLMGLGVRARLPFRVQQLTDKIVIDVAHTW